MRSLLFLFLACGCLTPQPLRAQSETPADREIASETRAARDLQADPAPGGPEDDVAGAESSAPHELEKKRRKQKLEIGLILTSVIMIMGIFLVVLTLLYGRRTKRQLAAGRGPSAPRDELWYLKKSQDASSANVSDAEQEEGTE